jgi:hypothetical protein
MPMLKLLDVVGRARGVLTSRSSVCAVASGGLVSIESEPESVEEEAVCKQSG